MDPTMMAALMGSGGSGGGTGLFSLLGVGGKILAGIGAGYAQSDLDKFSASIAGTNAQIAALQGGIAGAKGALDIGRTAGAVNDAIAGGTLHAAAGHLDPTYGSPLFLQANDVLQGHGDMAIIAARTAAAQASAKAAEASAIGQRDQLLMKSKGDIMAGFLGAGTAALSSPAVSNALQTAQWPWQSGASGGSPIYYSPVAGGEGG